MIIIKQNQRKTIITILIMLSLMTIISTASAGVLTQTDVSNKIISGETLELNPGEEYAVDVGSSTQGLIIDGAITIIGGDNPSNKAVIKLPDGLRAFRISTGGELTLKNVEIRGTGSRDWGAGIYVDNGGTVNLIDCIFQDLKSSYGGAICNDGGIADLTDCIFTGNIATVNGSAIYNAKAATTTLSGCTFDNVILPSNVYEATVDDNNILKNVIYNAGTATTTIRGSVSGTGVEGFDSVTVTIEDLALGIYWILIKDGVILGRNVEFTSLTQTIDNLDSALANGKHDIEVYNKDKVGDSLVYGVINVNPKPVSSVSGTGVEGDTSVAVTIVGDLGTYWIVINDGTDDISSSVTFTSFTQVVPVPALDRTKTYTVKFFDKNPDGVLLVSGVIKVNPKPNNPNVPQPNNPNTNPSNPVIPYNPISGTVSEKAKSSLKLLGNVASGYVIGETATFTWSTDGIANLNQMVTLTFISGGKVQHVANVLLKDGIYKHKFIKSHKNLEVILSFDGDSLTKASTTKFLTFVDPVDKRRTFTEIKNINGLKVGKKGNIDVVVRNYKGNIIQKGKVTLIFDNKWKFTIDIVKGVAKFSKIFNLAGNNRSLKVSFTKSGSNMASSKTTKFVVSK